MEYLLLLPLSVHLLLDSIRIIIKKKFVNHIRSGWITLGTGIVVGIVLLFAGTPWWASFISMLCLHFGLFSLLLNIVRMLAKSLPMKVSSLWHLNDPKDGEVNWWDEKLAQLPIPPWALILMWLWFAGVGIAFGWNWQMIA